MVSTLRQATVPDALMGRVTSAYRLVVLGAVPFGAALGGLSGRYVDLRAPFLIAAAGLTVVAVVLCPRITTAALRRAEEDAARRET